MKTINWQIVFIRLGTISRNMDFTRSDFTEYVADNSVFRLFKRENIIHSVARGLYYPTVYGWSKIDAANINVNALDP